MKGAQPGLPASTALIHIYTNTGVLTGPEEVTAFLLGLGPQSALAGAAKGLSASTASKTIHLCTSTSQLTGRAISIKAENVKKKRKRKKRNC